MLLEEGRGVKVDSSRVPLQTEELLRVSALDILSTDEDPNSPLSYYDRYLQHELRLAEAMPELNGVKAFPEKPTIVDIYINEKTGLATALILLPSQLTKAVGATGMTVSYKPEAGVEEWKGKEQKERRGAWISGLTRIKSVAVKNHGYGGGEGTIMPVFESLAVGELLGDNGQPITLDSGQLLIGLMSKGSAGTYRNDESNKVYKDYLMETTLAQWCEALCYFESMVGEELLEELLERQGNGELEQIGLSPEKYVAELLRIGEILSGTWLVNRMGLIDGHSMAGWETLRIYFANYLKRGIGDIEKYRGVFEQIIVEREKKRVEMASKIDSSGGVVSGMLKVLSKLHDSGVIAKIDEEDSGLTHSGESTRLGQLGRLSFVPLQNSRNLLVDALSRFANSAVCEVETPAVLGPHADNVPGQYSILSMDKDSHVKILTVKGAPGLRLLRMMQDVGLSKLAVGTGTILGIVEHELGKMVDKLAHGVNSLRAAHMLGIVRHTPFIQIDDRALAGAPVVMGSETIQQAKVHYGFGIDNSVEGRPRLVEIPMIHMWVGGNDQVLGPKEMKITAQMLSGFDPIQFDQIYTEDEVSGHYLRKNLVEKLWTEGMQRMRALEYHRQELERRLAKTLFREQKRTALSVIK